MSWFKRNIGLEWFDLLLHVGITFTLMAWVGMEGDEEVMPAIVASSMLVLGVRRHFALKKGGPEPESLSSGQMTAMRLEELEQRLTELDLANARITELEDRLDFAERLLAQSSGERARLPAGGSDRV